MLSVAGSYFNKVTKIIIPNYMRCVSSLIDSRNTQRKMTISNAREWKNLKVRVLARKYLRQHQGKEREKWWNDTFQVLKA